MDVQRIFVDYGVEFVTESGHRHAREGWVNTECPFCKSEEGHFGYHLGWNIDSEYFYCWRCGPKPTVKTLSNVLNTPLNVTYEIIKRYGVVRSYKKRLPKGKKPFKLPSDLVKLTKAHKRYLKSRNFNPDKVEKMWGLKSTTAFSYLYDKEKEIDYRFRIYIPFRWNGEVVSFDTRDTTDKAESKYKACPIDREVKERKSILYGNQEEWETTGIGVEGPTDVWRLGDKACALSGIAFTQRQVREIANHFTKFAVVFDDEPQAQRQAQKLVKELQFRNVDAYSIKIEGDPGDMDDRQAKRLVKSILNKK